VVLCRFLGLWYAEVSSDRYVTRLCSVIPKLCADGDHWGGRRECRLRGLGILLPALAPLAERAAVADALVAAGVVEEAARMFDQVRALCGLSLYALWGCAPYGVVRLILCLAPACLTRRAPRCDPCWPAAHALRPPARRAQACMTRTLDTCVTSHRRMAYARHSQRHSQRDTRLHASQRDTRLHASQRDTRLHACRLAATAAPAPPEYAAAPAAAQDAREAQTPPHRRRRRVRAAVRAPMSAARGWTGGRGDAQDSVKCPE
jgi:hypothetical protein